MIILQSMICLDVSNSMNVRDVGNESRLDVSKRLLNGIINKLKGQKIGVCLFAADAFIQLPPTTDYESVKYLLSNVQTTFFSRQGTNVTKALDMAMNVFSKGELPKSILLITDGENHINADKSVYGLIKNDGVLLYSMGIGTSTGGPVPDVINNTFKMDENGAMVISKVNADYVNNLSKACDGKVMLIDSAFPDQNPILTEINLRSKGYFRNLKIEVKQALLVYPVFIGFVFFILFLLTPGLKIVKNEV